MTIKITFRVKGIILPYHFFYYLTTYKILNTFHFFISVVANIGLTLVLNHTNLINFISNNRLSFGISMLT